MPSKTEDLIAALRRTPLFAQLVPMEAAVGWPWPLGGWDGGLYVALPFFGTARGAEGHTVIYPPFARLTVRWRTGLVVEYVNLRFDNPWPEGNWIGEAGLFPHPAVAGLSRDAYLALRAETFALYDGLFDRLERSEPADAAARQRLTEHLGQLLEPGLQPFYRALAPGFFDDCMTA